MTAAEGKNSFCSLLNERRERSVAWEQAEAFWAKSLRLLAALCPRT